IFVFLSHPLCPSPRRPLCQSPFSRYTLPWSTLGVLQLEKAFSSTLPPVALEQQLFKLQSLSVLVCMRRPEALVVGFRSLKWESTQFLIHGLSQFMMKSRRLREDKEWAWCSIF